MIEMFRSGKFDPDIRFSVEKFTRFTRNIDCSPVEYFFNLGGKICITDRSGATPGSHRHNFAMHLFRKSGEPDMTNWNKFRILEFEDEESKCFYTGSFLMNHDMTELGNMLDKAVATGGSIELTFLLDTVLKKDVTSKYLDIVSLQSLALTNELAES
jgi:hypothetical protein